MTDGPLSGLGNVHKAKTLLRKNILSRRDSITPGTRAEKDGKIRERLLALPVFKKAHTVLFYASFRGEVDTFELMRYFLSKGGTAILPRVNDDRKGMTLFEIKSPAELAPGYFGVPEPPVSADLVGDKAAPDLIIVPGVAFDGECNRLGYGKGFYDKLLRQKGCAAVALAYEEQIAAAVPHEPHDVRMDMIITDKGIIERRGRKED